MHRQELTTTHRKIGSIMVCFDDIVQFRAKFKNALYFGSTDLVSLRRVSKKQRIQSVVKRHEAADPGLGRGLMEIGRAQANCVGTCVIFPQQNRSCPPIGFQYRGAVPIGNGRFREGYERKCSSKRTRTASLQCLLPGIEIAPTFLRSGASLQLPRGQRSRRATNARAPFPTAWGGVWPRNSSICGACRPDCAASFTVPEARRDLQRTNR